MMKPKMLIITGQPGSVNANNAIILPMLDHLGFDVTTIDSLQLSAAGVLPPSMSRSDYVGCIYNAPSPRNTTRVSGFFAPSTPHPWPILALNTSPAGGGIDATAVFAGVTVGGVSGNDPIEVGDKINSGSSVLCDIHNLDGDVSASGLKLGMQGIYKLSGEYQTGAAGVVYTPIVTYLEGATRWPIMWRRKKVSTNEDAIWGFFREDYLVAWSECMAQVGYYLRVLGISAPKPFKIHLDIDDIQTTPLVAGTHCITELIAYLRAKGVKATLGLGSFPSLITAFLASDAFAKLTNNTDDVFDWIIHDHGGGADGSIWERDLPGWDSIASKLDAFENGTATSGGASGSGYQFARIGRLATAIQSGLGDKLRLCTPDGYIYLPSNRATPLSIRALLSAGVKVIGLQVSWTIGADSCAQHIRCRVFDNGHHGQLISTAGLFGSSNTALTTWAQLRGSADDALFAVNVSSSIAQYLVQWSHVQRAMMHGPCLSKNGGIDVMLRMFELTVDPLVEMTGGTVVNWFKTGDSYY